MILVWGFKNYAKLLGIVTFVCATCHNPAAQRVVEHVRKFTFFWIPLFKTKTQTIVTCTFCGTSAALNPDESARLLSQIAVAPAQSAADTALPSTDH